METTEIAAMVIVLIVLFDKALNMLKSRGIDLLLLSRRVEDLHGWHNEFPMLVEQVKELHKWHDVSDDDGIKVWYVRGSLEKAIHSLAANIATETQLLSKIDRRLESIEIKLDNPKVLN